MTADIQHQIATLSMHIREIEERTRTPFTSRYEAEPHRLLAPAKTQETLAYTRRLRMDQTAIRILEELRNMLTDASVTEQVTRIPRGQLEQMQRFADDIVQLEQTRADLMQSIQAAVPDNNETEEFEFEEEPTADTVPLIALAPAVAAPKRVALPA